MAGEELFRSDYVSITPHVARFGGVSYQMSNIGSVRVGQSKSTHIGTVALVIFGVIILYYATQAVPEKQMTTLAIALVFLTAAFIFQRFIVKHEFTLILKTSSGDIQAYKTTDKARILNVRER